MALYLFFSATWGVMCRVRASRTKTGVVASVGAYGHPAPCALTLAGQETKGRLPLGSLPHMLHTCQKILYGVPTILYGVPTILYGVPTILYSVPTMNRLGFVSEGKGGAFCP